MDTPAIKRAARPAIRSAIAQPSSVPMAMPRPANPTAASKPRAGRRLLAAAEPFARHDQPGILTGQQRVIVATSEPAYTFNRLVAAHQLFARKAEPTLVRSVGDAFGVLRMIDPAFSSIGFDKADHLDRVLHDVLHQLAEVVRARSLDNEIVEATLQRVVGRAVSAPVIGHITLSEVLNVSLRSKVLRESGIRSECCDCGARRPLSWMSVSVGRVTTYSCPACGSWLVKLSQIGNTLAADASGYVMGGFEVVSRVTLDIWGVKLPKTES
jgi:hypothetical protein